MKNMLITSTILSVFMFSTMPGYAADKSRKENPKTAIAGKCIEAQGDKDLLISNKENCKK